MVDITPFGRPLKFSSAMELQVKIDAYFESLKEPTHVDKDGVKIYEPATITGLALALDTSRQTLMNYEERADFFDTIKKAKTRVEHFAEKKLFSPHCTGAIFALKNFGWKDTSEVKQMGDPQVIVTKNYTTAP